MLFGKMDTDNTLSQLKAIIRSLIVSNRDQSMAVQQLERDFYASEGSRIPYAMFGYHTLIDFLRSMPDVLKVYGNAAYAFVQVVTIPSVQHVQNLVQNNRRGKNPHFAKKGSPHRKLYNYEKPVPFCTAPLCVPQHIGNQYASMPKPRNNFEQLQPFRKAPVNVQQPLENRHENTPEMRNNLENVQPLQKPPVHVQQPIDNQHGSTPKTQPATKENNAPESAKSALPVGENVPSKKWNRGIPRRITCDHTNERLDVETPCSSEVDWINMLNRPKEAMNMKSFIPEPDLTPFASPKGVLLVRILHVVNPNRIWVRCIAHQMPYEKLQNELNKYYKHGYTQANGRDYTWKMTEFKQGMYCAALWESCWYRGIIVGPHMGGSVKVNLVDLGMVEFIDDRHIQYLQEDFSKPNVLAIRASLAYLKPRRPIWSRAESDHLEQMLDKSEQFCANIVSYDEGHNAMDIVLQGAKMANVNKTFASEVDATYVGKDQLTDEDIDAYRRRSRTINEKYPTFHCIEVGHFPTVGEMRRCLQRNFDFEQHYAQIPHNPEINIPQQFKMTHARIAEILNWSKNKGKEQAQG